LIRQRGHAFSAAAYEDGRRARSFIVTSDEPLAEQYGPNVIARPDLPGLIAAFAEARPRPTGLFIATDQATAAAYPLLARHGIQPDRDIKIISCDNEEARLSALFPRPVSIELGTEEIGRRAVRRLLMRIESREESPLLIQTVPRIA
jgi:DNA-binding LacI/PurR family transcriptional regulator